MHYYNDVDAHACEWLLNLMDEGLIPRGVVDNRSIADVSPQDLEGFVGCHFFAGVGGWPLALRWAGWDDARPVWTGSCPCQPYSSAGEGRGDDDPRNLWPRWFPLIAERRPDTVFGEQVDNAVGHGWLDRISADLEVEDYAVGAGILPASGVAAPQRRYRLFFVAGAGGGGPGKRRPGETRTAAGGDQGKARQRKRVRPGSGAGGADDPVARSAGERRQVDERRARPGVESEPAGGGGAVGGSPDGALVRSDGQRRGRRRTSEQGRGEEQGTVPAGAGEGGGPLGFPFGVGREGVEQAWAATPAAFGARFARLWDAYSIVRCEREKLRRIEPGLKPLVDGVPFRLADLRTRKGGSRVAMIRGIGNAICPQIAARFVQAYMMSNPR